MSSGEEKYKKFEGVIGNAVKAIERFRPPFMTRQDLFQIGFVILEKALNSFDPDGGSTIEQWVYYKVYYGIIDEIRKHHWIPHKQIAKEWDMPPWPVPLNNDHCSEFEMDEPNDTSVAHLFDILSKPLTIREKEIMRMHLIDEIPQVEIAKILFLNEKTVSSIIKNCKVRMANEAKTRSLDAYLEDKDFIYSSGGSFIKKKNS
jgi:RNA polymerase sigma factor (sigma-70 family)